MGTPPRPEAPAGADDHLREVLEAGSQVYRGHFLDVRRDRVRLPGGATAHREYIVHPGAVMIIPLLDDGRLVVERQFRYPVGQVMVEFPAGKLDAGEPTLDCGVRELREETGYTAREWAYGGVIHNAIAYSTEGIHLWFARGLQAGERRLDEGEFLDVLALHPDELEDLLLQGRLTDVKTQIGLMWWRQWREGRRVLDWQAAPSADATA